MKDFNTLKGYYIGKKKGIYRVCKNEYIWHIPKALREKNIKSGDIALVAGKRKGIILVSDVFREDIEDTGKYYKSVVMKIENLNIDYEIPGNHPLFSVEEL